MTPKKHESRADEIKRLRRENARMKRAIRWVCGEIPIRGKWFGDEEDAADLAAPRLYGPSVKRVPFWWRAHRRRHAGMEFKR